MLVEKFEILPVVVFDQLVDQRLFLMLQLLASSLLVVAAVSLRRGITSETGPTPLSIYFRGYVSTSVTGQFYHT